MGLSELGPRENKPSRASLSEGAFSPCKLEVTSVSNSLPRKWPRNRRATCVQGWGLSGAFGVSPPSPSPLLQSSQVPPTAIPVLGRLFRRTLKWLPHWGAGGALQAAIERPRREVKFQSGWTEAARAPKRSSGASQGTCRVFRTGAACTPRWGQG